MIKTGLIWTGVCLVAMLVIIGWAATALPVSGEIPLHWNIEGEADLYASRGRALLLLLLLPITTAVMAGVFALAPRLDPFRNGLRRSSKAYLAAWISTSALMAFITGGLAIAFVRGAQGDTALGYPVARAMIAGAGVMLIVLGNYLPKTRQSFFLGVNTPWTLTSATAWEKTHRLAGPLFILAGLVGIGAAFAFDGIWAALPLSIAAMGAALVCVVYSYFAWRDASDKNEGPSYVA